MTPSRHERMKLSGSRAAGALVAGMIALGGCGQSAEKEISSSVEKFSAALSEGDVKAICAELTPGAQAELGVFVLTVDQPSTLRFQPTECINYPAEAIKALQARSQLPRRARITDVRVSDDKATVTTDFKTFTAKKREGEWRLSNLDPLIPAGN